MIEQRIEAYLLDAMSMDERTRFTEELKLDPKLMEQVELQRAAYAAGEVTSQDSLLNNMAKWEWKRSLPRKLFPLVAGGTTVIAVALLFMAWKYWPRPHDHFEENFETYPAQAIPSGAFHEASESYASGEYEKSARLFESQLNGSSDPVAAFYAGLSYLSADSVNASKAIEHLSASAAKPSALQHQAEWYLAPAYFKAGDELKARSILEFIAASKEHEKQEDAECILSCM
jgi:hypothetical protein